MDRILEMLSETCLALCERRLAEAFVEPKAANAAHRSTSNFLRKLLHKLRSKMFGVSRSCVNPRPSFSGSTE